MKNRLAAEGDGFTPLPGRQVALAMVCIVAALFLASASQTVIAATMPLAYKVYRLSCRLCRRQVRSDST